MTAQIELFSQDNQVIEADFSSNFSQYINSSSTEPLLFNGDSLSVLKSLPSWSVDFCMTSPPYWGKRSYDNGGIGLEKNYKDYIKNLADICLQIKRVLKPTGSFWLNIGDSYLNKNLLGIPWRVATEMTDNQEWILRNSIIWNKVKGGMDNSSDRLGNNHETIFHFVKINKGYFYDLSKIRSKPREARVVNGSVVSATGVTGVRYKRQIELSTSLSNEEKFAALIALEKILTDVAAGNISDFRMVIRGQQRVTHSDSEHVSGRAKELRDKGFYFLKYHPDGSKPTDVWDILPEDTQKRSDHFAPYPIELCLRPLLATCPPNGIVLDPFCGTGTTLVAAKRLGLKSIGIDISEKYLSIAKNRSVNLV